MSSGWGEAQERARSSRTKGDAMRAAASFSEGDNVGGGLGRRLCVFTSVVVLECEELDLLDLLDVLDSEELERE